MADFSNFSTMATNLQNVQDILRLFRNIYGACGEVNALIARYEADTAFQAEWDHMFTAGQTVELGTMGVQAQTLYTDWAGKGRIANVQATGVITVAAGGGVLNKTFIVGTQTFTIKAALSQPRLAGEVLINATPIDQAINIATAIGQDSATSGATATAATAESAASVNIVAVAAGIAGNNVAVSVSSGSGLTVSGLVAGKLSGGVNAKIGPLA